MIRTPFRSSQIISVGYSVDDERLEVEFVGGSVYEYDNVPPKVAAGFLSTGSVGHHFNENVKKAGYPYRKLAHEDKHKLIPGKVSS